MVSYTFDGVFINLLWESPSEFKWDGKGKKLEIGEPQHRPIISIHYTYNIDNYW